MARRLGVAVTTLRTWHQRYGLGPSSHVAGQHRRYTEDDLSRLEVMRRLTGQGVPAAEAARVALSSRPAGRPDGATGTTVRGGRAGGGRAIAVDRAGPAARGLASAAMRLDAGAMVESIAAAVRADGVVAAWDRLLVPVLVGIGDRHAATGRLVDVEHLLSRSISDVLAAVPRPASGAPPRILIACADEEQHSLPLEALAAALAERGVGCRQLGARVPTEALTDAVRRTGPAAVLVWSQATATGDPAQLRALLAVRPRPVVIAAAGPGWPAGGLPDGIDRPTDLAAAIDLVLPMADH
jgi:DNA-binding transcriptional MerR regulator